MAVKRKKTAAVQRTVKTAAAATRRRRRSSPIKFAPKRRRRSGMADGPMGKGLTPLLMQTAGGAAVGLLTRLPKPTFLAAVPDTMFQAGLGIVGGFVTQKFIKQPALAAGMFGAAGFLITQAVTGGMAEEDFPLSDYEIIDEEDLQELEELEELEEDEEDEEGIYRTPTGELVMMSDDGQNYFRVGDGSMYIPGSE
jgi:hypothetical protein